MIKIKALYETIEEKDKLLNELKENFKIAKVSKQYENNGVFKRVHIELLNK